MMYIRTNVRIQMRLYYHANTPFTRPHKSACKNIKDKQRDDTYACDAKEPVASKHGIIRQKMPLFPYFLHDKVTSKLQNPQTFPFVFHKNIKETSKVLRKVQKFQQIIWQFRGRSVILRMINTFVMTKVFYKHQK